MQVAGEVADAKTNPLRAKKIYVLAALLVRLDLYQYVSLPLCVTDVLFYHCHALLLCYCLSVLQVENYHEHVKMTKLKTASGKEKRSTREVGNELKSICSPCVLGPNLFLALGPGKKRGTGSEGAFRIRSNFLNSLG